MKALVLEAYHQLTYKDVPDPAVKDDEVLVSVRAVGVCGSDVHGMDGSTGRRVPPIIMGHEASGEIVQVGSNVTDWRPGDRVTFDSTIYPLDDWYARNGMYNLSDNRRVLGVSCKEFRQEGAYAELVAIPQHILYRIPDNVPFAHAAMVEPAAVALHAIRLSPLTKEDTVLVVGAGMVGLLLIQLLKISGAKNIIAVDTNTERLVSAKTAGADFSFLPDDPALAQTLSSLTDNRGVDIAFEVVGVQAAISSAIQHLRKGGTLTLVGNLSPTVTLPLQAIVTRQLRLQGSCAINGEYTEVLELMAQQRLDVSPLISAVVPLAEGAQWFKRLYQKEAGLLKVILEPHHG